MQNRFPVKPSVPQSSSLVHIIMHFPSLHPLGQFFIINLFSILLSQKLDLIPGFTHSNSLNFPKTSSFMQKLFPTKPSVPQSSSLLHSTMHSPLLQILG